MRQAGVLAAAGILSLTEQVQYLHDDHENARQLANTLAELPGLEIDPHSVQTNMVFARITKGTRKDLMKRMEKEGVLISGSRDNLRLVTHYDFKQDYIEPVLAAFSRVLKAP